MLVFDNNLSVIHAYLCADGYVIRNPPTQNHKYYRIGFRNTNLVLLKDFQKRFKNVFGLEPRLMIGERCEIGNKHIYYKLTKNYSYYSREWIIPKLIKKNLKVWLRAFFDCESWVTVRKAKDRHIGVDSVNYNGLLGVKSSLSMFKIDSKINPTKRGGIFRLHIFGKNNLTKFQKEIDFLHPDKKKKLQEAIDSYMDYNWKFPNNGSECKEFINDIFKEKINNKRIRVCSNIKKNLTSLCYLLRNLGIKSIVSNIRYSGIGTPYYELTINQIENINKLRSFITI